MARFHRDIVFLWLAGVLASAQLGKLTALAPALRVRFDLSLPQLGWLISLLEVGGALFGFVAGLALGVFGARRMLLAGLTLLAMTGLGEAFASSVPWLFCARALEGIAYLLVVISAPTMIVARTTPGPDRDGAMALWSSFVPVGVGAGTAISGVVSGFLTERGVMLGWVVVSVLLLACVAGRPGPPPIRRGTAMPASGAWLLCAGFGCYTLFLCALTGLLPLFLVEQHATPIGTGSFIAGGVAMSALPGTLLAFTLLRHQLTSGRKRVALMVGVLTGAALLAPWIYHAPGLLSCTLLAALLLLLAGVARTLIFTRLSDLSGAQTPDDPRLASAQGLLTQCGAAGALLGPPLGAQVVQNLGWTALGLTIGLLILLMLACLGLAEVNAAPA